MSLFAALPWDALRLSLAAAGLATAAGLALALLLCLVGELPGARRLRGALDIAVTLPLVLPPTVLGYYLLTVLSRRSALGRLCIAVFGAPLPFSRTAVVLAATVQALPLCYRALRAALDDTDPALLRAARSLGASEARILWTLRLPLARRSAAAGGALAFARGLGDFGVTLLLAGDIPGETRTAALALYDAVQAGREAEAAALAAVLAVLAIAALAVVQVLGRRPAS